MAFCLAAIVNIKFYLHRMNCPLCGEGSNTEEMARS